MESNQEQKLTDRARRAQKIVDHPDRYKICEGCDSIVAVKVNLCPNCHSYRFESDPWRVAEQARELGSREQRSVLSEDLF